MSMVPISTAGEQSYATPDFIYDHYAARYPYVIDLAASASNARCPVYVTVEQNSLKLDWLIELYRAHRASGRPQTESCAAWLNPPFKHGKLWARKMRDTALRLLPSVAGVKRQDVLTMLCLSSSIGTNWYKDVARFAVTELITPRFSYVHPSLVPNPKNGKQGGSPAGSMLLIFSRWTAHNPTPVGGMLRVRHVTIQNPKGDTDDGQEDAA